MPVDPQARYLLNVAIADAYRLSVAKANAHTAGQVVALCEAIRLGIGADVRQPIMYAAAKAGQDSMLKSYDKTRHQPNSRGYPATPEGYRQDAVNPKNRRFAGRRLRNALASPDFFTATSDTLEFGNIRLLNQAAAQWGRLNFGAGAAGKGSHFTYEVHWGNLVVASVGVDEDARPGFSIPDGVGRRGYWVNGEYHPAGEGPLTTGEVDSGSVKWMRKKETKGVVARNFLDAGVRRIIEGTNKDGTGSLPDMFRTMYVAVYRNAEAKAALIDAGVNVTVPTNVPGSIIYKG